MSILVKIAKLYVRFVFREGEYDALKTKIRDILKKYPEVDWTSGVNTHAFD